MEINELLKVMVENNASDLHLQAGSPPIIRVDGDLITPENSGPLTPADMESIFEQVTSQEQ